MFQGKIILLSYALIEYKVVACKTDEFPMYVTGELKLISTNVREAGKSFEESNVLQLHVYMLKLKVSMQKVIRTFTVTL
jgi:hypothetical protein